MVGEQPRGGPAAPASSAAPSQVTSMTARVEAADISSKRAPVAAARSGNAVVAMGTASTA